MSLARDLSTIHNNILRYIELKYSIKYTHLNIQEYEHINDEEHMKVFVSRGYESISERDDDTYYNSKCYILPAALLERPSIYIAEAQDERDMAEALRLKAIRNRILEDDIDKATTVLRKYIGPADLAELLEKIK